LYSVSASEAAADLKRGEEEVHALLSEAKRKLLEARGRRIAPGRDEKILTGWNGLMISGLCWASAATGNAAALSAAKRAFEFISTRVQNGEGRLLSGYKDGKARLNGYLDDYAFMSMAALDLARFTDDEAQVAPAIGAAKRWLGAIIRHFKEPGRPGYYFTSDDHEALIQRPKTIYDQAIPSGTAVALGCMAALSEIDGGSWAEELSEQLPMLGPVAMRNPVSCGELLFALLLAERGPVVVSGPRADQACRHAAVFRKAGEGRHYLVCHRQSCGLPLADAEQAARQAAEKLGMSIA
jgi:hypothetical protein